MAAPQTSDDTADRGKSRRIGALGELWPFLRPYRRLLTAAILALVLTASVALILPMAVRRVVDNFGTEDAALLDQYFAAALFIAALLALGTGLRYAAGDPAGRAGGGRYPQGGVRPGDRHEPGLFEPS